MNDEFIGSGWAFPIRTDPTGGIALVTHQREIEESIRLILGTAPGERPMRPEFGCHIHDEIFSAADAATAGRIAADVRTALRRWEPRIELHDVAVTLDPDEPALLYVDVRYTIRSTNEPRNLVFPFYTIPAEVG
ncbi:MAG: GPW/gp25 family protein [Chloroflexi bacterium]|nr:GPW/gp25 family protein [Chloroflexota bacterium]